MHRKVIFVNACLLAILFLTGYTLVSSWKLFEAQNDPARIVPSVGKARMGVLPQAPAQGPAVNYARYQVIIDRNLFSDKRAPETEPVAAVVVEQPKPPELNPKPWLLGTVVSGSIRQALLQDPAKRKGGREFTTLKVGDDFAGFTVAEIAEQHVTLASGGTSYQIHLYDAGKPRATPARAAAVAAPQVVSVGGIAAPAGAGAAPSATTAAPPPGTASPAGATVQGLSPALQNRVVTDEQGRRYVMTPFGRVPLPPDRQPPQQP
ncbi:MAG: hypothetical protein HY652_12900 [Acidobacteria bacterium]|nr:hypothetical protein [Acidobacteriota bacterium]